MKLGTPKIEIDKEYPFKSDKIGTREDYANSLLSIINGSDDDELVISIDGPWGSGKTTFVEMFKIHLDLKENNINVVYIDAFKNDYSEDAFITISKEIIKAIKNKNFSEEKINSLIKKTVSAYKKTAPLLAKLGIPILTSHLDKSNSIPKKIHEFGGEVSANCIESLLTPNESEDEITIFQKKVRLNLRINPYITFSLHFA